MTITKEQMIAGISAIQLRDCFKKTSHHHSTSQWAFMRYLGVSGSKANKILNTLVKDGYLEPIDKHHTYSFALKGASLSMAGAYKRFNRAKGEQTLNDFLSRAAFVNASDGIFLYKIADIYLFGSFLDDSKDDYGDLDLIVILKRVSKEEENNIKEEYKKEHSSYVLPWQANEEDKTRRFLKAGNHLISVHVESDLEIAKNNKTLHFNEISVSLEDNSIKKGFSAILGRKKPKSIFDYNTGEIFVRKCKGLEIFYVIYVDQEMENQFRYLLTVKYEKDNSEYILEEDIIEIANVQSYIKKYGEDIFLLNFKNACKAIKIKDIRECAIEAMNDFVADADEYELYED